ncbi:hypothetical protein D3C80_250540 [compost metagenome]
MHRARIRETTQQYVERYRRVLEDVRDQGLAEYVRAEYLELSAQLSRIEATLASDPGAARDLSLAIGRRVHALPAVARGARQQAGREELAKARQAVEAAARARDDLEQIWQRFLQGWDDALARDLSFETLAAIRATLMGPASHTTTTQLLEALQAAKQGGEHRATTVRQAQAKAADAQAVQSVLEDSRAHLEEVRAIAPQVAAGLQARLDSAQLLSPDAQIACLSEVSLALDEALVDETVRREVVRAVYESLQNAGFVTEAPVRVCVDGEDEVIIRSSRPAGATAEFRIELSGGFHYEFDRYRGAACRKDIDTVLPRLEQIYGIELSNKRVHWENPDDQDQTAIPRSSLNREAGNEQ